MEENKNRRDTFGLHGILSQVLSQERSQVPDRVRTMTDASTKRYGRAKKKRRLAVGSALAVCMFVLSFSLEAYAETQTGYTYNYDIWGETVYSPDAYTVVGVFTAVDLGLEDAFKSPQGMFVYGNYIYICDTGNNRILELERTEVDKIELVRVIDSFEGDVEVTTFSGPTDINVTDDGYMYICDKNNNRILKLDMDLNYIMEFTKPTDSTFDQSLSFLPSKLTVDSAGRVYCIATNVNKGLIKYEADGEFSGFVGAIDVTYDFTDWVWKKIATEEQRAQMESFVPTEYDNLYMDHDGFIYVCTTNVSADELDSGTAEPIRRLNLIGDNILIENGNWDVIGDLDVYAEAGGYSGPSLFIDITAFDNDVYVGLDKVRGRLFAYDDQGNLLYAFGGNGNMDGYFRSPVAIDHMDYDLLVLDSQDASITLFTTTEYGSLIFQAIEEYQDGLYTQSGETWQEVLTINGNCELAYSGIGRALLQTGDYKEAMTYFDAVNDYDNYSKAFKYYRKEWVQANIGWIAALIVLAFLIPLGIGKVQKIKHEIDTADIFQLEKGSGQK